MKEKAPDKIKKSYQNFIIKEFSRSEIKGADYNPRKISEEARAKLKRKIKSDGVIMPPVINLRTMNIVSGHQRINILDELHRGKDYKIICACIDVDNKKEIELNVFLNNTSAMGEFDSELLLNLKEMLPEVDFIDDLGFDKLDLDELCAGLDVEESMFHRTAEIEEIEGALNDYKNSDMPSKKKKIREDMKKRDEEGEEYHIDNRDYYIVFVFNTNKEKQAFMKKIKKPMSEKYLKSTILFDILQDKFKP